MKILQIIVRIEDSNILVLETHVFLSLGYGIGNKQRDKK